MSLDESDGSMRKGWDFDDEKCVARCRSTEGGSESSGLGRRSRHAGRSVQKQRVRGRDNGSVLPAAAAASAAHHLDCGHHDCCRYDHHRVLVLLAQPKLPRSVAGRPHHVSMGCSDDTRRLGVAPGATDRSRAASVEL